MDKGDKPQMRRPIKLLCALCLLLSGAGCIVNELDSTHKNIVLKKNIQGIPVTIEVEPGKYFTEEMGFGPIRFNVLPQIVIWTENLKGDLIETIYITGAHGTEFKHGRKSSQGEQFYRESFPVWASKLEKAGKKLPSKDNLYTDSVTSATPMAGFTVRTRISDKIEPFIVFLEINKSGDSNKFYTKETTDWVGQPSIIYKAVIEKNTNNVIEMKVVGHGGLLSDKVDIHTEMSGLTTALEQIKRVSISLSE